MVAAGRIVDPKHDRHLAEEPAGVGRPGVGEVFPNVKREAVGSRRHRLTDEQWLVGATVGVGRDRFQMSRWSVLIKAMELDPQPRRRAAAGGIEHMGGKPSHESCKE